MGDRRYITLASHLLSPGGKGPSYGTLVGTWNLPTYSTYPSNASVVLLQGEYSLKPRESEEVIVTTQQIQEKGKKLLQRKKGKKRDSL